MLESNVSSSSLDCGVIAGFHAANATVNLHHHVTNSSGYNLEPCADHFARTRLSNVTVTNTTTWLVDDEQGEGTVGGPAVWRQQSEVELGVRTLLLWCLPPILVLGTVGNVLCVLVLQRKAMQTTPSSTYLMSLAATDTLLLYTSAAKTWVRLVSGFELLHVADPVCRITKYVFFTCSHMCAWLVVLLSLERFLVVSFPFHATSMALVRRPGAVTLVLGVVIMAVNVNVLWASQLLHGAGGQPMCVLYSRDNWMCRALPLLNMLLYSALPSCLILLLNVAIIVLVLRSMRSVRQAHLLTEHSSSTKSGAALTIRTHASSASSSPRTSSTLSSKTQRRLTSTLTVICVSWLLLSAPYCLMDNLEVLRSNVLVRAICYLLLYVNHALNFYIYCLTGKKFRHELQRTFGCRHPRQAAHKHHFPRTLAHHHQQHKLRQQQADKVKVTPTSQQQPKLRLHADKGKGTPREGPHAHLYN